MKRVSYLLAAAALSACASQIPVRVIGNFSPAPVGCQEIGPVAVSTGGMLSNSPEGNQEVLAALTLAKGGDTFHYTGAFPPRGIAYRCNQASSASPTNSAPAATVGGEPVVAR